MPAKLNVFSIDPTRHNPPCPWLPGISEFHDFDLTRRHGPSRGPDFHRDALRYAQSQWIAGKPAQAILQINKSWMADVRHCDDTVYPYSALVWILQTASTSDCGYLGNPVRHFQHLASRVLGPQAEIRSWRAWVCFHLAEKHLDHSEYPRDGVQISREGLWIPSFQRSIDGIFLLGWPGEVDEIVEIWRKH